MNNGWHPIESYKRNGTLVVLLVEYDGDVMDGHPLEDTACVARTVGFNNFEGDGEDVWKLAGWCWDHDHFTEGHGKPIAWQNMPEIPETLV